MLCFSEIVLEIGQMDPIRQAITISSICNKVFRTMFLKPDSLGIIPRRGYRIGDRNSVKALQCLSYIGRTRNNVTHAGNGNEVHLARVPNVKDDGCCAETNNVFEYLRCLWHGCRCIDTSPFVTLGRLCRRGMRRQKRGCRKSRTLVIGLFQSGGASLENCYEKIQDFKMNFSRNPM